MPLPMEIKKLNSREITRKSGSNFASSFWFLPENKRKALTTIYAYCRITDDIVDCADQSDVPLSEIKNQLSQWEENTLLAVQGRLNGKNTPLLGELSQVVKEYQIPPDYFMKLIEGVKMDLEVQTYHTFEDLYQYCYRVAGIVGLICVEIFGYKNPKTRDYAVNLGVAFQLTNILRDIKSDLRRGRVYLPADDLKKFNLSPEILLASVDTSLSKEEVINHFKSLIDYECRRAETYYLMAK